MTKSFVKSQAKAKDEDNDGGRFKTEVQPQPVDLFEQRTKSISTGRATTVKENQQTQRES